jgi:hypothetical protein
MRVEGLLKDPRDLTAIYLCQSECGERPNLLDQLRNGVARAMLHGKYL